MEGHGHGDDRHSFRGGRYDVGDADIAGDGRTEMRVVEGHVATDQLGLGWPDVQETTSCIEENGRVEPEGLHDGFEVGLGHLGGSQQPFGLCDLAVGDVGDEVLDEGAGECGTSLEPVCQLIPSSSLTAEDEHEEGGE